MTIPEEDMQVNPTIIVIALLAVMAWLLLFRPKPMITSTRVLDAIQADTQPLAIVATADELAQRSLNEFDYQLRSTSVSIMYKHSVFPDKVVETAYMIEGGCTGAITMTFENHGLVRWTRNEITTDGGHVPAREIAASLKILELVRVIVKKDHRSAAEES